MAQSGLIDFYEIVYPIFFTDRGSSTTQQRVPPLFRSRLLFRHSNLTLFLKKLKTYVPTSLSPSPQCILCFRSPILFPVWDNFFIFTICIMFHIFFYCIPLSPPPKLVEMRNEYFQQEGEFAASSWTLDTQLVRDLIGWSDFPSKLDIREQLF